jgi:hypothetical protein
MVVVYFFGHYVTIPEQSQTATVHFAMPWLSGMSTIDQANKPFAVERARFLMPPLVPPGSGSPQGRLGGILALCPNWLPT